MLVRRNTLKVALLTMLFVVLAGSNALAADRSCVRKGERIHAQEDRMVFVAKPISSASLKWAPGAKTILACSLTHRKRITAGVIGKSEGQSFALSHLHGDADYAAFVTNAGGVRGVRVIDLSSGSTVGDHAPLGFLSSTDAEVTSLALGYQGRVGWIAVQKSAQGTTALQVRESHPWIGAQVVADDLNIDPYFLRFAGWNLMAWSPTTNTVAVQSRRPAHARAKRTGSCVRKGESLAYSSFGVVVTKKRVRKAGWKGAYKLIACSTRYHRRVAIGSFGQRGEHKYGASSIQANVRFLAFASEDIDEDGFSSGTVKGFDLATGKLMLRRRGSSPRLRLDANGNIAWTAEYGPPRGGGVFRLNLFDARGVTTLVQASAGTPLDPSFLAFEDLGGETNLHYSTTTAYHRW